METMTPSPTHRFLPPRTATQLPRQLMDYVGTSFSLQDAQARSALESFLLHPDTGIFRGPYVRIRMPYAPWSGPAPTVWMPSDFVPYAHQARAFERLTSADGHEPQPTLVVTGTGSGKTESFLYPILDHARRMIQDQTAQTNGLKAIILYPMNALASDQADRLAQLITDNPELADVTAGIYTGDTRGKNDVRVSAKTLITSRDEIRKCPPDILLTNYKMLDQLLLRPEDRQIFQKSAATLRYLVLDEFHTYDGAQGSDVALLLRRLGLVIKEALPEGDLTPEQQALPLGRIAPVATSATMGSDAKRDQITDFATLVFGTPFDADSYITDTTLGLDEWRDMLPALLTQEHLPPSPAALATTPPQTLDADTLRRVVDALATSEDAEDESGRGSTANGRGTTYEDALVATFSRDILGLPEDAPSFADAAVALSRSPILTDIIHATAQAKPLVNAEADSITTPEHMTPSLVQTLYSSLIDKGVDESQAGEFLAHACSFIALIRARAVDPGRRVAQALPGVETHLWLRAIHLLDRSVTSPVTFRWWASDPSTTEGEINWLPAIYCRDCGASGWMVALQPGEDTVFESRVNIIRRTSITDKERTRPLMCAPDPQAEHMKNLMWMNYSLSTLTPVIAEEDRQKDDVIPVFTHTGPDAGERAKAECCPACGAYNSVRYLGAAPITLLSVALSTLFGSSDIPDGDKRTLIFTDSVQDAAYDAGFIRERNRALNLRTKMASAIAQTQADGPLPLTKVEPAMENATGMLGLNHNYQRARFELLPPSLAYAQQFRGFWDESQQGSSRAEQKRRAQAARTRLQADVIIEAGYRSDLSRSLASTGTVGVCVSVPEDDLARLGKQALEEAGIPDTLEGLELGDRVTAWMRGLLEMTRLGGGIDHEYFQKFIAQDGNEYMLNNRRARAQGYPRFTPHIPPAFPRVGSTPPKGSEGMVSVGSARGDYAIWSAAMLGLQRDVAGHAVVSAFKVLAAYRSRDGEVPLLHEKHPDSGQATIYALEPTAIRVSTHDAAMIQCTACKRRIGLAAEAAAQLDGAKCFTSSCGGHFQRLDHVPDSYYRRLYRSDAPRSIVASEHTSLVPTDERKQIEDGFKMRSAQEMPPDAANVLVATPTLEMGIDIGALSTVMLASMPTTVASYVQRVGRAGRLSGNSLIIVMADMSPKTVAKVDHPLTTINGQVGAPVSYLSAPMILRRQFLASLMDTLTTSDYDVKPGTPESVFALVESQKTILDAVQALTPKQLNQRLDAFLATLRPYVTDACAADLRQWVFEETPSGASMCGDIAGARKAWRAEQMQLSTRVKKLAQLSARWYQRMSAATRGLPDDQVPEAQVDEEARREHRECERTLRATKRRLNEHTKDGFWISALERYRLLPNFTLVDDQVQLNIQLGILNTQDQQFDTENREYSRGIASALYEFAPGATFYVQSMAAKIDAVEMLKDGDEIEKWQLCPDCSYSVILQGDQHPATVCPGCRSRRFADPGQIIDVLPLRKVSAEVDPTRSGISEFSDGRRHMYFDIEPTYTIPAGPTPPAWYLSNGFGVRPIPTIDIHWTNLGNGSGEPMEIAGRTHKVGRFPVCPKCGHLDSQAGENSWRDHRAWCDYRHSLDEHTITFALGRTLTTEGIIMQLPPTLSADSQTLPSLEAALRLGFHLTFGGDPQHLDLMPITLSAEHGRSQALLLFDTVAGGTGYLSEFSSADNVHRLFVETYNHLANCRCASTNQVCCPDCLLGYADRSDRTLLSREAAVNALALILCNAEALSPKNVVDQAEPWATLDENPRVESQGSYAEKWFRQMFTAECESRGWSTTESSESGRPMRIRIPGHNGIWTMEEQKEFTRPGPDTIPDFYFVYSGSGIPNIAVYIDGAEYHNGADKTRSDANKRVLLRDEGVYPLVIRWEDLEEFQRTINAAKHGAAMPSSGPDDITGPAKGQVVAMFPKVSEDMLTQFFHTPIRLLFSLIEQPEAAWDRCAQAACMLTAVANQPDYDPRTGLMSSEIAHGLLLRTNAARQAASAQIVLAASETENNDTMLAFWHLANRLWRLKEPPTITIEGLSAPNLEATVTPSAPQVTQLGKGRPTGGYGAPITPSEPTPFPQPAQAAALPAAAAGAGTDTAPETSPWQDVRDEFEGESDILSVIDALEGAGAPVPDVDRIGEEVAGYPTLLIWGDAALLEDPPEDAKPFVDQGIHPYTLDEVDDLISHLTKEK